MPDEIKRTLRLFSTRLFRGNSLDFHTNQSAIWRDLEQLPFTGTPRGRRVHIPTEGKDLIAQVRTGRHASKGAFGSTKYVDLPMKRRGEEVSELDLDDDEGLDYPCHFGWWDFSHLARHGSSADDSPFGVLVWEHNQWGPRTTSFESYLNRLFDGTFTIKIEPIVEPDPWERVRRAHKLGRITVRVARSTRNATQRRRPLDSLWGMAPQDTADVAIEFIPRAAAPLRSGRGSSCAASPQGSRRAGEAARRRRTGHDHRSAPESRAVRAVGAEAVRAIEVRGQCSHVEGDR